MSWIQWQGETLPNTQDCVRLAFTLSAPDMGGPRQNWSLELCHQQAWPADVPSKFRMQSYLYVELWELGLQVQDLREFSGLVIRSTPAWLERVQVSGQYGHLVEPVVQIHNWRASPETGEEVVSESFLSLEWELRFGKLDGYSLPCELDVWALIPEEEFYRMEPETPEDLARFAQGEPLLRMMARAEIVGGNVEMERCGDDPVPLARKRLHAAVGGLEVAGGTVHWDSNYIMMPEHKAVKEPGWRSKVSFRTGA